MACDCFFCKNKKKKRVKFFFFFFFKYDVLCLLFFSSLRSIFNRRRRRRRLLLIKQVLLWKPNCDDRMWATRLREIEFYEIRYFFFLLKLSIGNAIFWILIWTTSIDISFWDAPINSIAPSRRRAPLILKRENFYKKLAHEIYKNNKQRLVCGMR